MISQRRVGMDVWVVAAGASAGASAAEAAIEIVPGIVSLAVVFSYYIILKYNNVVEWFGYIHYNIMIFKYLKVNFNYLITNVNNNIK
jgi:hypothetical protein